MPRLFLSLAALALMALPAQAEWESTAPAHETFESR